MLTDTLTAFLNRYPDAIAMWFILVALPITTCALWTWLTKVESPNVWQTFGRSVALTLGYPALLVGAVILPICAFQIFFVTALLEGYPSWRPILLFVLKAPDWLVAQAWWLFPVSWLLWAIFAPKVFINKQLVGGAP